MRAAKASHESKHSCRPHALPLTGPGVVELTHMVLGPTCGMLLADMVLENFNPDTMAKYGLDYASMSKVNPKLIYVSHKGFLPGP